MALALVAFGVPAWADMDAAKAFLDAEIGTLSVLDRAAQEAEMQWFVDAAKPFAGMDIKVVSETITTHEYESKVLAPAFTAITGIKITHDLIGEGDVVEKLQTQMQSGENIYDAYVNDSDLIGTHWRYQQARNLTEWMAGEGAAVTSPTLDLADFIGLKFTTAPNGNLYQLPDQQFANLYWFRYDWFSDAKTKEDFKAKYGYDLGVPVNWSAYEDIAEFFTEHVREIDLALAEHHVVVNAAPHVLDVDVPQHVLPLGQEPAHGQFAVADEVADVDGEPERRVVHPREEIGELVHRVDEHARLGAYRYCRR